MNNRKFEQRVLDLIFHTSERLTPHLVSYRLDVPFAEAKQGLERLAKEGVLAMESDESGNVWFEAPGVARAAGAPAARREATFAAPELMAALALGAPAPRVVAAPRRLGALPLIALAAGGLLALGLLKYLLVPLLIVAGVAGFGLWRLRRSGAFRIFGARRYAEVGRLFIRRRGFGPF
jgi:hypothetical protein